MFAVIESAKPTRLIPLTAEDKAIIYGYDNATLTVKPNDRGLASRILMTDMDRQDHWHWFVLEMPKVAIKALEAVWDEFQAYKLKANKRLN